MKSTSSKNLRIAGLLASVISSGSAMLAVVAFSGDLIAGAIFLIPGPFLLAAGISLSFLNEKRPALLRIETVIGVLITFFGAVIGMFSVGGILMMGLLVTAPVLFVDWLLWKNAHRHIKSTKPSRILYILVIAFQILFSLILLFYITGFGFIPIVVIAVVIWNVFLFISIKSYFSDRVELAIYGVLIVVAMGIFIIAKQAQPDFWATIIKTESSSSSGGGGTTAVLSEESGGIVFETVDFEYQELFDHYDVLIFKLNDRTYKINSSARTVFYGVLEPEQSAARKIILTMNDGSNINSTVKNREFVLQSPKSKAHKSLDEVRLINDNNKVFLKEKIDREFDKEIEEFIKEEEDDLPRVDPGAKSK
ncbi:hypothetical protein LCGC14_2131540 [marine sediment metagenome]|uniref:Uncharacterized protein n=1 Tax=marine sediment metagenome TaxID=412755 RepID=A0A0F9ENG8_9ZZZZ